MHVSPAVSSDTEMGGASASFPTTRASFVAGMSAAAPADRSRAADVLVRAYWKPVYKYVRLRHGKSNDDAKDLTQAFLAHALEKEWLARFDPRRGTFRAFLRLSVDGFVANDRKSSAREKRGGTHAIAALDFDAAEGELARLEPIAPDSVDAWFEQEWRRELFAAALGELEQRLAGTHPRRLEIFRRYDLAADAGARPSYADVARALGVDTSVVTNELAAARQAFRELVLARLRAEAADEDEFRAEVRALFGAPRS